MSQLTSKFESETGNVAIYRKDGADYHTLRYVNWLESLVEKFKSAAQGGPANNGSTPCRFFSREKVHTGQAADGGNMYQSIPWCNHEPSQRAVP
jgi:hypothetical protein